MPVSSFHEIITPENYKFFKGDIAMDKITHQVRAEHWTKILNECIEYSGRFYTPIPEIGNHRSDMKETAIPF